MGGEPGSPRYVLDGIHRKHDQEQGSTMATTQEGLAQARCATTRRCSRGGCGSLSAQICISHRRGRLTSRASPPSMAAVPTSSSSTAPASFFIHDTRMRVTVAFNRFGSNCN
ncbi:hypothetical protein Cni_G08869 [Canna indica]|uniref:Uncharacterized protein n=1 Tax=Canna indica TaxID=4628 RepID=A0AAQ3Q623_9LILI|nr:hypothetical protein Cni_G08869 [Canna indica]